MPAELWSIDADGDARVHPAVEVPADALGMAAGPGGVWIVEPNGVVQLQPGKGTRRVIPLPGRPTTIEIDAHLGVWIGGLDRGGQGILWNIDPTTGRIVHSFALPDSPESLAVAASGSPPAVWVISPAVGTIHQVDATSGEIIGSNYFGYTSDIATDSTLAWVADGPGHSVAPVPSLALRSPFFHEGTSLVFPGSDVIAVTEEMLWGLDARGERVFPVDLATDRVGTPISVGSRPTSIALDGGFLWVANERSVSRIDGTTHSLSTIALPGRLSFIAVTSGPGTTVWVLAQGTV
jgi:streptogramin lyase